MVLVIRCQTLLKDVMDNIKLLLICILRVLLPHSFIFFRFYSFINVYMVLFLFDNVIYVFVLLWLCILTLCLCMSILTEVFPCFLLSCKANARVKPAKTGHGPHSSKFLCCCMYCLFCVVLCIVCVYMCTELLSPGGYPTAVKYIISYHNLSFLPTCDWSAINP